MLAFRHVLWRAALLALAALVLTPTEVPAQGQPGRPQAARPGGERAAGRLALVIGNAAYKEGALANPVNDAKAMAAALRDAGFTVMLHTDLDQRRMTQAVRDFGDALRKGGGVGLFYFAGHGVQIKGRNYLVPVGADIQREDEVAYAALDAQSVLDKMEAAGNGTNVLILDACRNNPFARSFRSAGAGLAQMEAPVGTLVAFATAPGMVASDGTGSNGLYTQNLLEAMRKPGLKIEDVFKQVRVAVRKASSGKQVPWESTSLEGDLYFSTPAVVAAAPAEATKPTPAAQTAAPAATSTAQTSVASPTTAAAPVAVPAPDEVMWQAIQASAEPVELRAFLRRFPQSRHADEARRRLATTRPAEDPVMPAPPPRLALAQPSPSLPTPAAMSGPGGPGGASLPPGRAAGRLLQPSVGDTWSFQAVDLWRNAVLRHFTLRIGKVEPGGDIFTGGGSRFDGAMRAVRLEDAKGDRRREYAPHLPKGWEDWHPGRSTPVSFTETLSTQAGKLLWRCEHEATVRHVRVEKVRVPAGEFTARRYEIAGTCQRSAPGQANTSNAWKNIVWYVPEMRYQVAMEVETRAPNGQLDVRVREELTSFQVHGADLALR